MHVSEHGHSASGFRISHFAFRISHFAFGISHFAFVYSRMAMDGKKQAKCELHGSSPFMHRCIEHETERKVDIGAKQAYQAAKREWPSSKLGAADQARQARLAKVDSASGQQ